MIRRMALLFTSLATLLLLVTPAAAMLALSGLSLLPGAPLVPGGQQHLTARFTISPSGATTFISGSGDKRRHGKTPLFMAGMKCLPLCKVLLLSAANNYVESQNEPRVKK